MRYMQYLEDEKKKKVQTANKRESTKKMQISMLNNKKIIRSIEIVQKEADEMAVRAERLHLIDKIRCILKKCYRKKREMNILLLAMSL